MESLRWIFRYDSAVFRDSQQFCFSLVIAAFCCLTLCFIRHAMRISDKSVTKHDTGIPEVYLFLFSLSAASDFCDISSAFLHEALQTNVHELLVIRSRFSGNAVSAANRDQILLSRIFYIIRKHFTGDVLHRSAFPFF